MTSHFLMHALFSYTAAFAYPSYLEATRELHTIVGDSNSKMKIYSIGTSVEGRAIHAIEFGKGPAVFVNGCHHGNEKASVEVALTFIRLVSHILKSDDRLKKINNKLRIVVVPFVNPDGYEANTRFNHQGYDINRDYAYPDRSDEDSFKLKETQVIRDFLGDIQPRAALALHSGGEGVFWPWAFSQEQQVLPGLFGYLSSAFVGYTQRRMQSFEDYETRGEFIDFAFMRYGTWALTVELTPYLSPPAEIMHPLAFRASVSILGFLDRVSKVLEL